MSIETNGRMSDSPPSVDVYLTEDAVIVELEVPGYSADELAIVGSDRMVTVSGHRAAVDVATTTFVIHPDSAVD
jgi:HSP20 family molecular chaperone IbpA